MEIRRVTKVDQNLIRQLNDTFIKGKPDGKSGAWVLENAQEFVRNPDNIFLTAHLGGNLAGMLSAYKLQRMDSKKAELFFYEIGVTKNYRQQGVGKTLIAELKKIGKNLGIKEMFVLTNRSNLPAVRLYRSTGGVPSQKTDEVMFTYKI